jgi:hypothetical protein
MSEWQEALMKAYVVGLLIGAFGVTLMLSPYLSFRPRNKGDNDGQ